MADQPPIEVEIVADDDDRPSTALSDRELRALVRVEELRTERTRLRWDALKIIAVVLSVAATCVASEVFP